MALTRTRITRPPRSIQSADSSVSVSVRSLRKSRPSADTSRQVDPNYQFSNIGGLSPLHPPYALNKLASIFAQSNMLQQCVSAYVTNIALNGWEIVASVNNVPMDKDEVILLQSFIDCPNSDESLKTIHAKVVEEYERFGFSFVEVIRDIRQRVSILRHATAVTMGVCAKNADVVLVEYDVVRGGRVSTVREYKTFRIFCQVVSGQITYFKEFGDTRVLDYKTGRFGTQEDPVAVGNEATEIIHFRQNSDDVYGVPRWLPQLPSILGSREVEEVNLQYFEDNTVPPMLLSVAGGRLTGQSFRDLKALLDNKGIGKERQNQILLVEAVAERESLDDKGSTVQLKVDKLADVRPSDGLFKDYDEGNQSKIRSSFRLPPVAVGLSQDQTFATANVSTFVAETQVYAPLRAMYDEVYNKRIVTSPQGLNLKTVLLRSKAPSITNPEILIRSLTALNVMGAITPRLAREVGNTILQIEIPQYPQINEEGYEDWMDMPISITLKAGNSPSDYTSADPTGAGNTHADQNLKDPSIKNIEQTGNVSPQAPENGQQ